jgi:hypothetical protein
MPVSEDLSVAYHQQDTDYYCGAACAQMVLNSIGTDLLNQDDLYNDNHSHSTTESDWYSGPDGVLWTMNNRKPPSPTFNSYFVLDALDHEDSISRAIVWTIHHYKVAPIAMVYGSQHWIVVRGFAASAAPTGFSDIDYTISGFFVNNPWPPAPSWYNLAAAPPPPHSGTDGCGSGANRGIADEHIAYTTWQADYMTGVPGGHWAGKFIAVCDPDPPPTRPGQFRQMLMRPLPGDRIIDANLAVARANEGLQVHGLLDRDSYRLAHQSGRPGTPVLVQRLDRLDNFYSIVPITEPGGTTPLVIAVDARTGVYLQSAVRSAAHGSVFVLNDRNAASQLVVGRSIQLTEPLGRLLVRPEAICYHPTLVWKPCRESLSPFFPFHLFTVGNHPIYVRSDGAVFTALHDSYQGI